MCMDMPLSYSGQASANYDVSVFVNGRSRPVIFEDMRRRISRGDIGLERKEAIQVRCIRDLRMIL